jgi:hypothetical protein
MIRAAGFAPTTGARLIRVEKTGSAGDYENFIFTYNDSDMLWAFYVRRSAKTGQYEVSNNELPAVSIPDNSVVINTVKTGYQPSS